LTEALKQRGIPYNTHNKWVKKFAKRVATVSSEESKPRRGALSEDQIRKRLSEIAALRDSGMSRAQALAQLAIRSVTYDYWVRRFGKPVAAAPAQVKGKKGQRRSPEEVRKMLSEVAALRASGKTKAEALAQTGVNPHNYLSILAEEVWQGGASQGCIRNEAIHPRQERVNRCGRAPRDDRESQEA